jgi:hypothetical protein
VANYFHMSSISVISHNCGKEEIHIYCL